MIVGECEPKTSGAADLPAFIKNEAAGVKQEAGTQRVNAQDKDLTQLSFFFA